MALADARLLERRKHLLLIVPLRPFDPCKSIVDPRLRRCRQRQQSPVDLKKWDHTFLRDHPRRAVVVQVSHQS